jgi:hypothetical protein
VFNELLFNGMDIKRRVKPKAECLCTNVLCRCRGVGAHLCESKYQGESYANLRIYTYSSINKAKEYILACSFVILQRKVVGTGGCDKSGHGQFVRSSVFVGSLFREQRSWHWTCSAGARISKLCAAATNAMVASSLRTSIPVQVDQNTIY